MSRFGKESYCIACEMPDGSLELYAGVSDPESFLAYQTAKRVADDLNKQGKTIPDAKTDWQVYKMNFEKVEVP